MRVDWPASKWCLCKKEPTEIMYPLQTAMNKTVSLETIGAGSDAEQEYTLADRSVIKTVAKADGNYEIYVPGGKTYGIRFEGGSTELKNYFASEIADKLYPFYSDGTDTYQEGENELEKTERYNLWIPKHTTESEYRIEHQDSGFVKTRGDLVRKISGRIWFDEDRGWPSGSTGKRDEWNPGNSL